MKPKYEIGKEVYLLDYSRVEKWIITGVFLDQSEKKNYHYKYCFKPNLDSYGWIKEDKLFPSKEELIKSL